MKSLIPSFKILWFQSPTQLVNLSLHTIIELMLILCLPASNLMIVLIITTIMGRLLQKIFDKDFQLYLNVPKMILASPTLLDVRLDYIDAGAKDHLI